jgi:anti-anti-sigma regulatory factor
MTSRSTSAALQNDARCSAASLDITLLTHVDAQRVAALRGELDEAHSQWTEQIAATVEEDYRQLMKDFGLR